MVLRSGKEVDNKVNKKEHDKDEGPTTLERDLESKKENDSFPSSVVSDPTVTYTPRVLYSQALDAPSPRRRISTEMTF